MVRAELPGVEGLQHQRRQGRGGGGVRPLGLGQIDADQMRQRAGAVPERRNHPRRHQGQRGNGKGRKTARPRRPEGSRPQIPGRAVRRPAAAGRDRPRAGDGPDCNAVRRADLGARSGNDLRSARCDGRSRPRGHDHDGGHPRNGFCQQGRASRDLHGPGRNRRGRAEDRFLRQPAQRSRAKVSVEDPVALRNCPGNSRTQCDATASQPTRRKRLNQIAYVNGSFVPLSEAKVSILDRGFLFADGIYEVAAVLDGKLIDNASHLARLERSVGEIALALPETPERIQEIQKELVARNNLVNGMVYLEVTRGADKGRDFAFPKAVAPTPILFTSVKDIIHAESAKTGIGVITVPDLRWTRRDIKSVALLAQVLAKQAAAEAGAGEAWMIEDGMVTEGGSSSAFILTQDDVLVTRQNSSAILPGCTRKAVVALAEERQLRVEERPFSIAEALAAKEAFITSATVFVQAVVTIDGKTVANGKPGPMTDRLREIYVDFARATAV